MARLSVCTLLIIASQTDIVISSGFGSGLGSGSGSDAGPGPGNCVGMFSATDNCDFYLKFFNETVTCPILESKYGMDCLGCSCIIPVKNMSSTPAATTTTILNSTSTTSTTPFENTTSTTETISKSTTIDASSTTTSMSAILEKEIEQVNAFADSINKALQNGDFEKNMLDLAAFDKVTAVKLVANLDVKPADAKAETPTQLEGKCQISGLKLSDFQESQRDAFKTVMAATSGAKKEQVLIKNVFDISARSRFLRRQLSEGDKGASGVIVEFAITIERDSKSNEAYISQEKQGLSPGVIAAVVIISVIATAAVATGAILYACRKITTKRNRVGCEEDTKRNHKNKGLSNFPDSYALRNFSSTGDHSPN